jgi:hypothetical protein
MPVNQTTVDDPLMRLIQWHSATVQPESSDPTPPLDDDQAVEAALIEWHGRATG